MTWASASDFFAMGGYGLFVWGSYGTALVIFVVEPWLTARRHHLALLAAREEAAAPSSAPFVESVATGRASAAAPAAHAANEVRSS